MENVTLSIMHFFAVPWGATSARQTADDGSFDI
jgi:hypothetical protein